MKTYSDFLNSKVLVYKGTGMEPNKIHPMLFDFQKDIVRFALKKGRAAIFADCGLGKSFMQIEWARQVGGKVLILAPLAVSLQTIEEGKKLGIEITPCSSSEDVRDGINITNYEKLHKFDPTVFAGIVLDESSILKSYSGKVRNAIIKAFRDTKFKLACTATPSPNDYMELGNHAEFLGVMKREEMLAMFFVHDGERTSSWRLKGHAQKEFWKWICSWSVYIRTPSDLGYSQEGFNLPELRIHRHIIKSEKAPAGHLFPIEAQTLEERRASRKSSLFERVEKAKALINGDQWLVWCNLNSEADAMESYELQQISGSTEELRRTCLMTEFAAGRIPGLVTKPKIAGFGMNWQNCSKMIFLGLSDSFEEFYQAVRRCWRFGQKNPVDVHVIVSSAEASVLRNIERKQKEFEVMAEELSKNTKDILTDELHGTTRQTEKYEIDLAKGTGWTLFLGDSVEIMPQVPDDSVGLSVFSPPFASLYTYSNSDRDMGNCKNSEEFLTQFAFLVDELYRVTMPGRLCVFHCMLLPTSKARDGMIGLQDFRGDLIRLFRAKGWIYHSEVVIWKDPVIAMQRTKALGLLHKQIKKDSCMSRMGIPDYVVAMRKPGDNPIRVVHTDEDFPVSLWQKWASPIWDDINPSDTLQKNSAREEDDERHICPLQLEVIRRCLHLWSRRGDTVLSPFAGIGSEGYEAIKADRKFIGIELKRSYWEQGRRNLAAAEKMQGGLFAAVGA